ncbi:MAG: anti-sigma factor family protein [Betaproteobacteria bacterium]
MTCEKAMSLISAYLDKELAFDEFRQVELHLASCETCSEEYETLKATQELLGTLKAAELPREFWPELREKLGRVAAEERSSSLARSKGSASSSRAHGSWWRGILFGGAGSTRGSLFSSTAMKGLVSAALVLLLATAPMVWSAHRRSSATEVSSQIDSLEPYFHDYIISEYDRPLSDKTSIGFVVTGQAVTMYTSDLLGPSSKVTQAGILKDASPSPSSAAGTEYTLISYPR